MSDQFGRSTSGRVLEEGFPAVKSVVHLALQKERGESLADPRLLYNVVVDHELSHRIDHNPAHHGERHEAYPPLNGVCGRRTEHGSVAPHQPRQKDAAHNQGRQILLREVNCTNSCPAYRQRGLRARKSLW